MILNMKMKIKHSVEHGRQMAAESSMSNYEPEGKITKMEKLNKVNSRIS
jgi:hypothetical protein